MHDRRDRVEEGELGLAGQSLDCASERLRGEGAGRNDHALPFGGRQPADLLARDRDRRMRFERARHLGGEAFAVDGERAACRQLVSVAGLHDQRAGAAHLLMQQADGVRRPLV